MIQEHDTAVLARDFPNDRLKTGDVGAAVLVHGGGDAFEAEFMTLDGDTQAVITVEAVDVRPTAKRELASARQVA